MIKAIVLDIGGVLIRTEDRTCREELEVKYHLSKGGVDKLVFNSEASFASTLGTTDPNAIWQNVATQLMLNSEALEEFKQAFWQGDRVDQDLIEFLQDCRPMYKTAFLSNAWLHTRAVLEEKYGIKEDLTVDHILISSELGVAKPDPRIFKILSETIACEFFEILFVDDFIENIKAAINLSIETIHYKPGLDLINEIKSKLNQ